MKYKSDGDTNDNWCTRNGPQRLGKRTRRTGNRKSRDHLNYSIIEIDQNAEESWKLETCSHSDSSETPSANASVKKNRWELYNIYT